MLGSGEEGEGEEEELDEETQIKMVEQQFKMIYDGDPELRMIL